MEGTLGCAWCSPKCIKIYQNAPKLSPNHDRAKYFEFHLLAHSLICWWGCTWGQLLNQDHNSNVILCYGVPHVQHHNSFMTCSVPFQVSIYYRQIQNPWLCHGMVTILVHLATFWCTSRATPWLLHDLLWLLSPFQCPLTPEMTHISHWGQIQNTLLRHGTVTFLCILVNFVAFCCTFCATLRPLHYSLCPLSSVHLLQKWIT